MNSKLLGWAFLCAGVTASALSATAAEKVGIVVAAVGNANASGPSGNRALREKSEIFEDDKITVGGGNVQIILDDQTRLVVGPSSSLVIDQYVRKDKKKASKIALKALRGTYRMITGNSAKSAYRISTAQATIGIRGTAFDFWTKAKTGAIVLRGTVRLSGANGGFVDVKSGCNMGVATPGAASLLSIAERNKSVRENLPFILDQSTLTRRFQLDVTTCRLGPPGENGNGGITDPPPQEQPRGGRGNTP
jgi:FecR protein